ncbi:hypothetical protein FQR65_LT06545 [Abscondita terminalis]|nr:hypothetical protein FQR65_LT06545 [Abscondita terminalis]
MSVDIKIIGNDSSLGQIFNDSYLTKRQHYVEVGPDKVVLPGKYEEFYDCIDNFEVRDDDVFICAFPKTGSRWTQELVWLILNNLDFENARDVQLGIRSPLLELELIFDDTREAAKIQQLANYSNPRCIRSHLQWSLLPKAVASGTKQPKIIVVLREPEDTCTSYFHQAKVMEGFRGTWDDFCHLFIEGKVLFGPYFAHVLSFWEQRHRSNVMFVKYNKMKADLRGTIEEVASFLGKSLTKSNVEDLFNHLSFDNLKKSQGFNMEKFVKGDVNPFLRTGKIGDYKNAMSDEVIKVLKKQREHYLAKTSLTFD